MRKPITLPTLAEGIEGGDVVSVLVHQGDEIQEGQSIIELETDKATVPVPSPFTGKIAKINVQSGERIRVGQPIVEVEDGAQGGGPSQKISSEPKQAAVQQETAVLTPQKIAPEPVAPPLSQKTSLEKIPTPILNLEQPPVSDLPSTSPDFKESGEAIPAAPSVRRLARELGVDLRNVQGSASGGRITLDDVKAFVRDRASNLTIGTAQVGKPSTHAEAKGPIFTTLYGTERREPLPSIRRKIAANMTNAWSSIPHVHQFHEVDITELMELQKRFAAKFKQKGATLTLTSLILKAVTHALKMFPQFNSSIDLTSGEVIYKDFYNIGVAVDTPSGLIVPVIHNVDKKELLEIALELADIAQRTREKQVKLEELRGATFTVSNLGGIGGGAFTPIINPPEVAILGVGRGRLAPVYKDGAFIPRTILPLCVAYDHRLIDGADGARFITEIAKVLEDYEAMFLGL